MRINSKDFNQTIEDWTWTNFNRYRLLQSKLLNIKGFKHGFLTKSIGAISPFEIATKLGQDSMVNHLNQVHGNKVIDITNYKRNYIHNADSIISNKKDDSLWIYTADCIPILIGDQTNGQVCACHAGWRGIASKVLINSIYKLIANGAKIEKLLIAMGPSIGGDKYQVREEVVKEINNSFQQKDDEKEYLIIDNHNEGYFKIDIKLAARKQLIDLGIKNKQISLCPICTFSNSSLFHSWRREKKRGRQWSFIISQSNE